MWLATLERVQDLIKFNIEVPEGVYYNGVLSGKVISAVFN